MAIPTPSALKAYFEQNDYPTQAQYALLIDSIPIQVTDVSVLATLAAVDGQVVVTSGYTTAGDGGGNIYYLDTGSVATPDGGFVIAAVTGNWIAVDQSHANVLKFGADPTRVTDSSAAFQAAIDAMEAKSNGGRVYIPAGGYQATVIHNRAFQDEIEIVGDGPGTSWRAVNENEFALTIIQIDGGYKQCFIRDIQFVAVSNGNGNKQSHGIFTNSGEIKGDGLHFFRCGIGFLSNACWGHHFSRCTWEQCYIGTFRTSRNAANSITNVSNGLTVPVLAPTLLVQAGEASYRDCTWNQCTVGFYIDQEDNAYPNGSRITFSGGLMQGCDVGWIFLEGNQWVGTPFTIENMWTEANADDGEVNVDGTVYLGCDLSVHGTCRVQLREMTLSSIRIHDTAIVSYENCGFSGSAGDAGIWLNDDSSCIGTGINYEDTGNNHNQRLDDVMLPPRRNSGGTNTTGSKRSAFARVPHRVQQSAYGKTVRTSVDADGTPFTGNNVNIAGHTFEVGMEVMVRSTGTLPTPLAVNTRYFIKTISAGASVTLTDVRDGTVLTLGGSPTGTFTVYSNQCLYSATCASDDMPVMLGSGSTALSTVQGGMLDVSECLHVSTDATNRQGIVLQNLDFVWDAGLGGPLDGLGDLYILTFAIRSDDTGEVGVAALPTTHCFFNGRSVTLTPEWHTYAIVGHHGNASSVPNIEFTNKGDVALTWEMSAIQIVHFNSISECVAFQKSRSFVGY